jgi:hypothetical protein
MLDPFGFGREFFVQLLKIDRGIVKLAAEKACSHCGGRLYRSDYPRKGRVGALGNVGDILDRRFSLCCGSEGCRRRATPPSVRFLGRRVYAGAVVVVASVMALAIFTAQALAATGIPSRTRRRWGTWWRDAFPQSAVFSGLSGRLVPAPAIDQLPESIIERLIGDDCERILLLLRHLGPLTTTSCADSASFLRAAA